MPAFITPSSRIMRVICRVSTPQMPQMPLSFKNLSRAY